MPTAVGENASTSGAHDARGSGTTDTAETADEHRRRLRRSRSRDADDSLAERLSHQFGITHDRIGPETGEVVSLRLRSVTGDDPAHWC